MYKRLYSSSECSFYCESAYTILRDILMAFVRLSVQCRYCVYTNGHVIKLIDDLVGASFLYFWAQLQLQNSNFKIPQWGDEGWKILQISPFISKTIRDRPTITSDMVWEVRTGLRPQKSVLILHTLVLVLQVWCCVVKHGLDTLVVIMILKDTATFQVLFIVSLFSAWNISTVEVNSGVHLFKI